MRAARAAAPRWPCAAKERKASIRWNSPYFSVLARRFYNLYRPNNTFEKSVAVFSPGFSIT